MSEKFKKPKLELYENAFSDMLKDNLVKEIENIENEITKLELEVKELDRGKRNDAKQQVISGISKEIQKKKRRAERLGEDIENPSKEILLLHYKEMLGKITPEEQKIETLRKFSKSTKTETDLEHITKIIKDKENNLSPLTDELQKIKDTLIALIEKYKVDIRDLEDKALAA